MTSTAPTRINLTPSLFRLRSRLMALGVILSVLSTNTLSAGAQSEGYQNLADYKAAAAHPSNPQRLFFAKGQPNKLAAATAAQGSCAAAVEQQHTPAQGHCELVKVGDQKLTTTSDIKATLPKTGHPLFLWRVQSGQATVYLAGSIHILKPGLYPLAPQYQAAFERSDKLVVEVNLAALTPQQIQFKAIQYGQLPQGQELAQLMDAKTYAQLSQTTAEYGLPIAQMGQFKPAFITNQLAILALMSVGYDPTQGVESHFTKQAQDKEILQLETLDFQLNLLMNQPMTTQLTMVEETLAQMDDFERYTADLVSAWLRGDDASFEAAFAAQAGTSEASQQFMRKLMDERNFGMADKIAGYLGTKGTYFVLIGAAHYIGENNVLSLLGDKGFRSQRIHSTQPVSP